MMRIALMLRFLVAIAAMGILSGSLARVLAQRDLRLVRYLFEP